jgi:uncharacterized protein
MVRIAVVSDTHLPKFGRALPRRLREGIAGAGVDLILHLGDFTEPFVRALFEALAPFDAVAGNNDGPELVARFGRRKVLEADGVQVGLAHGDLGLGGTSAERARRAFAGDAVAVILFGHSHAPLVERVPGGPLLVNPGSPTDKRAQARYSWAVLELDEAEPRAEIRFFDDRSV